MVLPSVLNLVLLSVVNVRFLFTHWVHLQLPLRLNNLRMNIPIGKGHKHVCEMQLVLRALESNRASTYVPSVNADTHIICGAHEHSHS